MGDHPSRKVVFKWHNKPLYITFHYTKYISESFIHTKLDTNVKDFTGGSEEYLTRWYFFTQKQFISFYLISTSYLNTKMYNFTKIYLKIQKVPFLKSWVLLLEQKLVQNLSKLGVSRHKNTHQPYVLVTFLQFFLFYSLEHFSI